MIRATAPPPSEISVSVSSSVSQKVPGGGDNNYDPYSNSSTPNTVQPNLDLMMGKAETSNVPMTTIERSMPLGTNGLTDSADMAETSQFCNALKERVFS